MRRLNEQYRVFNYVWGAIQKAQGLCVGGTVSGLSNKAVYWGTLIFLQPNGKKSFLALYDCDAASFAVQK